MQNRFTNKLFCSLSVLICLILLAGCNTVTPRPSPTPTSYVFQGRYVPTGNLNVARSNGTATLLKNGKVLVVGGLDVNYNALASTEIYDPATGKFTLSGSMHIPRSGQMATLLANGDVLIAGGVTSFRNGPYNNVDWLRSAELYNPATGTFTMTGNMYAYRFNGASILLPGGKVLITGGTESEDSSGLTPQVSDTASNELYDPATGQFTRTGDLLSQGTDPVIGKKYPYNDQQLFLLSSGKVLLIGMDGQQQSPEQSPEGIGIELYDPATGVFTDQALYGKSLGFVTATKLANDQIFLTLFQIIDGDDEPYIYNPEDNSFSPITVKNDQANIVTSYNFDSSHAFLLQNGQLFFSVVAKTETPINTQNHTGGPLSSLLYNFSSQTFNQTGGETTPPPNCLAVELSNGMILFLGGGNQFTHGMPTHSLKTALLYQ